jgi:predicted histidine transporter YuiF (NhaC family)
MALVKSNVSEEHITSIIKVERISKVVTVIAVTINRSTLQDDTVCIVFQLLVTANVPSSFSLSTLMMKQYVPLKHWF